MYWYIEFKLRYLKNMKLFEIRVKKNEAFFTKKDDGVLHFLKAFSWETDLWVTLDDFRVKKAKLWTENRLSRHEMCAADNHNYMCHMCAKGFLDSNFY